MRRARRAKDASLVASRLVISVGFTCFLFPPGEKVEVHKTSRVDKQDWYPYVNGLKDDQASNENGEPDKPHFHHVAPCLPVDNHGTIMAQRYLAGAHICRLCKCGVVHRSARKA